VAHVIYISLMTYLDDSLAFATLGDFFIHTQNMLRVARSVAAATAREEALDSSLRET